MTKPLIILLTVLMGVATLRFELMWRHRTSVLPE